jgi:hypothetical protein
MILMSDNCLIDLANSINEELKKLGWNTEVNLDVKILDGSGGSTCGPRIYLGENQYVQFFRNSVRLDHYLGQCIFEYADPEFPKNLYEAIRCPSHLRFKAVSLLKLEHDRDIYDRYSPK